MRVLIIDFAQNISDCNYFVLWELAICHYCIVFNHCIEATVCSIRYLNAGLPFILHGEVVANIQ